jgi:DNA modification methylase
MTATGRIITGDSLEILQGDEIADESLDSCVSDTPYNLTSIVKRFGKEGAAPHRGEGGEADPFSRTARGFMGQEWDGSGIAFRPELWQGVYRKLKPGAWVLAFGGTRTYHRLTCAIEDAGFEIRDCMAWVYATGFPKSHDMGQDLDELALRECWRAVVALVPEIMGGALSRGPLLAEAALAAVGALHCEAQAADALRELIREDRITEAAQKWAGWGTALKPAWEPIVIARKPLSESSVARNLLRHGTGALNVEQARIARAEGDMAGWAKSGAPAYAGLAPGSSTFQTRPKTAQEIAERNAGGRFPPNFLLGHGENCQEGADGWQCDPLCPVALLGEQGGRRKSGQWNGQETGSGFGGKRARPFYYAGDEGSAARFFPQFPPFFYVPKPTKGEKNRGLAGKVPKGKRSRLNSGGLANDPRWAPVEDHNIHPTVKPIELMRYLVRLVTPEGGTCLDHFAGSGTTGVACLDEGRSFVGIEKGPEYSEIARARMGAAVNLFAGVLE